jgi:hypothetical protein
VQNEPLRIVKVTVHVIDAAKIKKGIQAIKPVCIVEVRFILDVYIAMHPFL